MSQAISQSMSEAMGPTLMTINPMINTAIKPLTLTIRGGVDKDGHPDAISEIEIAHGEIIGIVGPTGSGKSTLIADIEQFASGDTPSGRRILINGLEPAAELRSDPRKKLVAQLSQNMHFLAHCAHRRD